MPALTLDRLLERLGADVVVHPRLTLVRDADRAPERRPDWHSDVADLYERHVFGALKTLAAPERECIELTYFDGLGVDEVATRSGVSAHAVEDRLRRGMDDMLRYLRARA